MPRDRTCATAAVLKALGASTRSLLRDALGRSGAGPGPGGPVPLSVP